MKKAVGTSGAPAALGPYSQAIVGGGLVWASGQIGVAVETGALADGGVEAQTRQALENLRAVLEAAGSSLDRVVRSTVYLADLGDFESMNRVYALFFPDPPPARACVQVAGLPRGARVEIDAVALA